MVTDILDREIESFHQQRSGVAYRRFQNFTLINQEDLLGVPKCNRNCLPRD